MSTAILHAGSFIHDFNDIVMKVCRGIDVWKCAENDRNRKLRQEFEKHMFCFHNVFFFFLVSKSKFNLQTPQYFFLKLFIMERKKNCLLNVFLFRRKIMRDCIYIIKIQTKKRITFGVTSWGRKISRISQHFTLNIAKL